MGRDYIKEKANSLRNEMNHLWTAMLVTCGVTIGFLFFESKNSGIAFFIILGLIMTILFVNAYFNRRIELREVLKELMGED